MSRCRTIPIDLVCSVPHIDLEVNSGTAVALTADTAIIISGGSTDPYTGDYEVTPHFAEQTLFTQGKMMTDDVTVHQIPVVRTTNPYGGQTVLIG